MESVGWFTLVLGVVVLVGYSVWLTLWRPKPEQAEITTPDIQASVGDLVKINGVLFQMTQMSRYDNGEYTLTFESVS